MTTNTYRVGRGHLFGCLAVLALFTPLVVFGGVGIAAAALGIGDKTPIERTGVALSGVLVAAVAVPMWCYAVHLLLAGLGGRLTVSPDGVQWTSLFRRCQVSLSQVVEARWRGESLRLRTPEEKLTIDFSAYPARQRPELIRFFRFGLSEGVQHGWEAFWLKNWRRFDVADPNDPVYVAMKRAFSRRLNVYFALGLVPLAAVFVWQWTSGVREFNPLFWRQWLVMPLGYAFLWGCLRVMMASTGGVEPPPSSRPIHKRCPPPPEDRHFWWIAAFFPAPLGVMLVVEGLKEAGWPVAADVVMWTGGCALLVALFVTVFIVSRCMKPWQREMEAWRREAARLAEQEYMAQPDGAR